MQRAIGLISMLLMLHLSLVGSDMVCATHGAVKAHAGGAVHSAAHDHSDSSAVDASQQDDRETSPAPARCNGVMSCAPTIAIAAVTAVEDPSLVDAAHPAGPTTALLSRVIAPETPPPKA